MREPAKESKTFKLALALGLGLGIPIVMVSSFLAGLWFVSKRFQHQKIKEEYRESNKPLKFAEPL